MRQNPHNSVLRRRGRWSNGRRPWSVEEVNRAVSLRITSGWDYREISRALDRSMSGVKAKLEEELRHRGLTEGHAALNRPTLELLADRDARLSAGHQRTQTQEFFGDPPPGYSALDMKRKGVAP